MRHHDPPNRCGAKGSNASYAMMENSFDFDRVNNSISTGAGASHRQGTMRAAAA